MRDRNRDPCSLMKTAQSFKGKCEDFRKQRGRPTRAFVPPIPSGFEKCKAALTKFVELRLALALVWALALALAWAWAWAGALASMLVWVLASAIVRKTLWYRRSTARVHRAKKPVRQVPASASFLLYLFLNKKDRQTIPGDLQEEFQTTILPQFGPRRAKLWYWSHTLTNIAYRNPIIKWALAGGGILKLTDWLIRRISG